METNSNLLSEPVAAGKGTPRILKPTKVDRFIRPFGRKAYDFAFRPPENDKLLNILEGAVRSGKTWAMHPKMLQLLRYDVGGLKIITGQSKQTVYNNILNDLFTVLGKGNYSYNRQSGELSLMGDQWFVIGARDEGSEKMIRGSTIGICYSDELTKMPKSFLMMLLTRLSLDGSRFYGTTNPDNPFHYLKTDIIDNPDYADLLWKAKFTLNDNPNISPQFKSDLHRMFKGVFYRRFILGEWVMAEGAIYGSSLDGANLFNESSRPIGLYNDGGYQSRIIAVDYGTTNPMVFGEILDDGRRLWQIGEYYWDSVKEMKQKTDDEYAEDLKEFIEASPVRRLDNVKVIVDPSAASFKLACRAKGLYVVDADNDVEEGIKKTSMMLASKRYMIHKDNCPHTQEELMNYSWDEKKAMRGLEEPIKKNDHCADMVRYGINTHVHEWRALSS